MSAGKHAIHSLPPIDRNALAHAMETVFAGVNAYGIDPDGGWSRPAFSDADMAARSWLCDHLSSLGLTAQIDPVGNVIARWGEGDAPAIMVGSHTDSVRQGGAYDGVFGVAAAIAAVLALRDMGVAPLYPIEVVSFADEEGRFGGMLGSQSLSGQVSGEWIASAKDADGVRLTDAMHAQGLNPDDAVTLTRAPRAFLEAHVEQGPVLEAEGVSVGIVPSITGVSVSHARLQGQADHSGTTPMTGRRDALAAAAQAISSIPNILTAVHSADARATVGKLSIKPNTPHTIPGLAEFTAVLRDPNAAVIAALEQEFSAAVSNAAQQHSVHATIDRLSILNPVHLDANLFALAAEAADAECLGYRTVPSGAGHDAQSMQTICPSALLFAPSRGGISHVPDEHTDLADMANVAAVLTRMLGTLATTNMHQVLAD